MLRRHDRLFRTRLCHQDSVREPQALINILYFTMSEQTNIDRNWAVRAIYAGTVNNPLDPLPEGVDPIRRYAAAEVPVVQFGFDCKEWTHHNGLGLLAGSEISDEKSPISPETIRRVDASIKASNADKMWDDWMPHIEVGKNDFVDKSTRERTTRYVVNKLSSLFPGEGMIEHLQGHIFVFGPILGPIDIPNESYRAGFRYYAGIHHPELDGDQPSGAVAKKGYHHMDIDGVKTLVAEPIWAKPVEAIARDEQLRRESGKSNE